MGGVAGHLSHLYDNRDLTFNEMAKILQKAASGELVGTEKTDGYNIYLGYVDGKPRAARNKGDMSRGGMTFEDLINREFRGGEDSKRAYVTAFNSYVSALDSLSEKEKAQIFGPNGEIFYNTEIQGPVAPNVVNYDENVVNIHRMGHKKYNKEDNTLEVVANEKESAFLDSVIDRFEEATANEDFRVRRTAFLTLNKITDEAFVEEVLNRIQKTGYSGDMTINDYLHDKLIPYTAESLPELDDQRVELLVRRMLGDKAAPTTTQITKGMDAEVKAKVSAFNKNSKFLIKKLIEPIEMAIHDFAVELLRGLKSAYILDNESEVERLKNETESAIRAIQDYEGPEQEAAQDILVRQLTKLKHHDNIDTVVEGFVFQHDGQMYKFTGNFAPMNQLLGLFRYGRGKIPQMVKEMLREQNEGEIVAILPGKFKPAHRGHLDMIKHYAQLADRVVVLVSPKEKDGITAQTAAQILNMYLDDANITNTDVEIPEFASPVRAAMEYGNSPEMEGTKIILGASTKGGDAAERFGRNVQKYVENAEVLNPLDYAFDPVGEVLSATDFRNALRSGENIERFLPDTSKDRAQDVADMVKQELKEEVSQMPLGIFFSLIEEVLEERASSNQQRRWACAQMGKSRKKFKGKPPLNKKEAEKMCTDPLKEEQEDEYFDYDVVEEAMESFFPDAKIHSIKLAGSTQKKRDWSKEEYEDFYEPGHEPNDIDVEVEISGITDEEAEEWMFSEEAEELEAEYGYDVLIRVLSFEKIEDDEQELDEISAMGAGAVQGYAGNAFKEDKTQNENYLYNNGVKLMESANKDELRLRRIIRESLNVMSKNKAKEEQRLKNIIRHLIQEVKANTDVADSVVHNNTGINVLDDLLKNIIKTIEKYYKNLASTKEERDSFRYHFLVNFKNALQPVDVNRTATKLNEQEKEEKFNLTIKDMDDDDISDPPDESKFLPARPEDEKEAKEKKEEEEKTFVRADSSDPAIKQGADFAEKAWNDTETQILSAYESLTIPEDAKLFYDYGLTNLKLYFDKFESEMGDTIGQEPASPDYNKPAAEEEAPADLPPEPEVEDTEEDERIKLQ